MFRFTIRDVLWLMVVVGMGAGWFVYVRIKRQRYEEQRRFLDCPAQRLHRGLAAQLRQPPACRTV